VQLRHYQKLLRDRREYHILKQSGVPQNCSAHRLHEPTPCLAVSDPKESQREQSMYASIRRYKMEPKNIEALQKRIGGAVEVISKLPGFKAYYVIRGADSNTMATVSVFADKNAAEESNKTAATWVKANAADLFSGTPDVVVGEVVAHK